MDTHEICLVMARILFTPGYRYVQQVSYVTERAVEIMLSKTQRPHISMKLQNSLSGIQHTSMPWKSHLKARTV